MKFATTPKKQSENFLATFKPRDYQNVAIKFLLKNAYAGLLLDPGLGKTVCVLAAFYILQRKGMVSTMLVVTKRRIMRRVWPLEVKKWGFHFKLILLAGTPAQKKKLLAEDADIYLMTFESVPWLMSQPKSERNKFDVLCVDESSKFKSWRAKRTKMFKAMLPTFKRRIILTGSFRPRHIEDIFAQVYILDLGRSLGKFITEFRNRYMMPDGYMGYKYVPRAGALEEIYKKIAPLMLRFPKSILKLPPLVKHSIYVQLPEDVQLSYAEMETNLITEIKNEEIVAANGAVATSKCRQIASGGIYTDAKTYTYETLHSEKLDELELLIEELNGRPVLIAYEFRHERIEICKRLNIPFIDGETSDAKADEILDDWNAGKLHALAAHPDSVAHGLNLQEIAGDITGAVCFYSIGWNLENFTQFIERIWRQGVLNTVHVYFLLAENTIDDIMLDVMDIKHGEQEHLYKALECRLIRKQPKGLKMGLLDWKKVKLPGKVDAARVAYHTAEVLEMRGDLEAKSIPPPFFDTTERDEARAVYNFVSMFTQQISGWLPAHHADFLSYCYKKKIKPDADLATLYNQTKRTIFNALGFDEVDDARVYLAKDLENTLAIWPIKQKGNHKMTVEKVKTKPVAKKATTKKASVKKAAPKKKAPPASKKKAITKKAPAKRKTRVAWNDKAELIIGPVAPFRTREVLTYTLSVVAARKAKGAHAGALVATVIESGKLKGATVHTTRDYLRKLIARGNLAIK